MILQSFPGQAIQLWSVDSLKETPENANITGGQAIPQDVLNQIAPSGMPPHYKERAPITLLRNMHGTCGQAKAGGSQSAHQGQDVR
ncbi:hypothetical protein WJX79_001483 [Trebouxia sp. C0005]